MNLIPPPTALVFAGLLLAAACDGPTGPLQQLQVDLRVIGAPALTISNSGLGASLECLTTVEVTATGWGSADWTRVRRRTFRGLDRTQPSESFEFDDPSMVFFSLDPIVAGRPDTALVVAYGGRPFSAEYILWYRVRGQAAEDSVVLDFECGAGITPGAAAPAVTILELRGSDPVIEYGDTLVGRYRAEGGGPLWQSEIRLSGAFPSLHVVYEEMSLLQEREFRVVVPRNAALDTPITLTITLTDVGGRVDSASLTPGLVVVDVTPPTLSQVTVAPGQYHVGAPIRITTFGTDERGLAHLVWEFGAPVSTRDSIPIGGVAEEYTAAPIVRAAWEGLDASLNIWVRDHGNNYSAPWVSAPDAFRFHPLLATPAYTISELASPHDVVYDAPRERLYAVDVASAQLRAFSIASMSALGAVALPPWPGAADLTVSGDSLLITQSELRALSVVDLNTLTLIDTIALPPVDSIALVESSNPPLPTGVRVLANGKAIVKLHRKAVGGFNTVEVTLQSGTSRLRSESIGGSGAVDNWWDRMGVTADRSHLLLFDPGCARSYSSAGDSFSACAVPDPGDLRATRISSDAASTRVMIGGRVFGTDLSSVATIPYEVTHLLPDGVHALAATEGSLFRIRLSDGRIMSRMALPFDPTRLILLEDGSTLLAFAGFGASVAKFDISSMF